MTHTPGPWRLGRDVTSVGRLVYIPIKVNKHVENKNRVFSTTNATGPNKHEIVGTTGVYAHNPDNGRTIGDTYKELGETRYKPFITDEECRANARLIAAAPDLLAACKMALGAFEHNHAIDWKILVDAIEKAESPK